MPEIFTKPTRKKIHDDVRHIFGGSSGSLWGSFMVGPDDVKFETQHDEEEVVLLGRRHFITNIGWMSVLCFGVFVPMFWGEFPFFKALDGITLFKISLLWYTCMIFYGIQNFLLWFYNIYIVSTDRLVDVDFNSLLNKTVNVTQLSKIEDVNYSQKGIMESFFNYGDVIVETASEQKTPDASGDASAFTFDSVSNPDKLTAVISKLIENDEEERRHS